VNDQKQPSDQGEYLNEPGGRIDSGRIISYNIDEDERPGGIKVRFKIQVVTGKRAAAIDERQADAIRELLTWTRQQRTRQPPSR
jgi:hypothetical protein